MKKTGKTNKTKNSTNCERGSITKLIEKIVLLIVDGRNEDLHQYMMMRKIEWDEAEERCRQEREEARREREEARREREDMEDRRDHRMKRQFQQQQQTMQMMMMMMLGAGSRGVVGVANGTTNNEEYKNTKDEENVE